MKNIVLYKILFLIQIINLHEKRFQKKFHLNSRRWNKKYSLMLKYKPSIGWDITILKQNNVAQNFLKISSKAYIQKLYIRVKIFTVVGLLYPASVHLIWWMMWKRYPPHVRVKLITSLHSSNNNCSDFSHTNKLDLGFFIIFWHRISVETYFLIKSNVKKYKSKTPLR